MHTRNIENKYRNIHTIAPDIISFLDDDLRMTFFNYFCKKQWVVCDYVFPKSYNQK